MLGRGGCDGKNAAFVTMLWAEQCVCTLCKCCLNCSCNFANTALCCYPNINSAIRNLGLNTPTAPIFLQFNYFRENIWVIIWVQFHFLYIFVGRVDRIHKTSHTRMLSFYFFASDLQCFGDELNVSSKTAPANI